MKIAVIGATGMAGQAVLKKQQSADMLSQRLSEMLIRHVKN